MSDIVIKAENLGKKYTIGHQAQNGRYIALRDVLMQNARNFWRKTKDLIMGQAIIQGDTLEEVWALKDVSFEICRGEAVGIIGRNGAGKSTLLKIISRITEPTTGRLTIRGRVASLLEVGTGFHSELTGKENIYLNGTILGMTRQEIKRKFDEIVAFAEVEKFLDTPVKRYSSGMYVRLAFAVAAHLEPEILLVDEVLAVGDAAFQRRCLGRMGDITNVGRTVLFVSHNMQAIKQLCQHTILMELGRIAFIGDSATAIGLYLSGAFPSASSIDLKSLKRFESPNGATFLSLKFLNSQRQPFESSQPSEQIHVVITFSVEKELAAFDMAMAILHADGTAIFSESLSDQDKSGPLRPGEYEIAFTIDLRFLKLESYFLTLYLADEGRPLDSVHGIPLPELRHPKADAFKEAHRWGLVRIPVRWSFVAGKLHG